MQIETSLLVTQADTTVERLEEQTKPLRSGGIVPLVSSAVKVFNKALPKNTLLAYGRSMVLVCITAR